MGKRVYYRGKKLAPLKQETDETFYIECRCGATIARNEYDEHIQICEYEQPEDSH